MFNADLFREIENSKAEQKLLIVPAQLTLSAEQAAFSCLEKEGFLDFHIMSGNKLRAEIINRTGGPGRAPVNTLGRSMILRKITKKLAAEGELSAYSELSGSESFLSAASDFIVQAKQNLCSASEALAEEGLPSILSSKLSDMQKISAAYEEYMAGKYMDSEDGLAFATEQAKKCDWIRKSEIWFAGFYSFTKREQEFLKTLDGESRGCHIILESPEEKMPKTLQKVYEAGSKNDQALFVAAEILRLIREEGYGAEDIAVLSADIAADGPEFSRTFSGLGIPLYSDEKRSLMHLDAARKIGTLLDMAADGLYPEYVAGYADDNDFSNYIRSYHIKPGQFGGCFSYGGKDRIAAEIVRDRFASEVLPFIRNIKAAESFEEKTTVLYRFLAEDLKLPEQMEEEALSLSDEGYPEAAEEIRQGWPVIISIFDQVVELLGDEKTGDSEYRDVIKGAFKDLKVGLLPQKSGCIIMGDIYRTMLWGKKVVFVTSFNDGYIPRNNDAEGILTENEQAKLLKKGITLCKSYEKLVKEDRAVIYNAFAFASEKLYFSYSLSDIEGSSMRPGYMLLGLEKTNEKEEIYSLENLIGRLRDFKTDGKELSPEWKTVARNYSNDERYKAAVKGLLYRNESRTLSSENRAMLRPEEASASSLEKYAACPYGYFIGRAIRPEEEFDFSIDRQIIGNIHHEILMRLSRYLSSDGRPVSSKASLWQTITDDEIRKFVSDAADSIAGEDESGLYTKGPAESYRMSRIKTMASGFAVQMVRQVRLGNIDRIESEEVFELSFAGTKIKGKIDRMDITDLGKEKLVKIIDYKSGNKTFKKDLIEKGLDIQLMLYIEAATEKGEKPVGSFYFHIENPEESVAVSDLALDEIGQSLKTLDGAYVSDRLIYIDKSATGDTKSEIVKKNAAMSEAEYEDLRKQFREKLEETISRLNRGDISVSPRKTGSLENDTSCRFCRYRSVCGFEADTEGFKYS